MKGYMYIAYVPVCVYVCMSVYVCVNLYILNLINKFKIISVSLQKMYIFTEITSKKTNEEKKKRYYCIVF